MTEQNRLYPERTSLSGYWPSYDQSTISGGIEAVITNEKAKTIEEVFGEENMDLQFTSPSATDSFEAYIADNMSMSNISYGDMKEWNGFLFVLVNGYKTEYALVSYTDYENNTKEYRAAQRPLVSHGEMESYLYVFDISRGQNYKTAFCARYSEDDLGFSDLQTRIMENVDIDDNYIYITLSNGDYTSSQGNTAYKNCRALAVFENAIKRGDMPQSLKRAEEDITALPYGARIIQESADNKSSLCYIYKSTIIDNKHILYYGGKNSLLPSSRKDEAMMFVSDALGDEPKKVYYSSSSFNNSLAELLPCPEGDWSATESPMIKSVKNEGTDFYFLVTYKSDDSYSVIYKTSWKNPSSPCLLGSFKFEYSGSNITADANLFKFGNKFYVTTDSKIDIIEIESDDTLTYLNSLAYASEPFEASPTSAVRLAAIGNYLYIYYNIGPTAYDIKAKTDDTGNVLSFKSGRDARQKPYNDVLIYGNYIYIPGFLQSPPLYRQNIVRVDITKLIPVNLTVDAPDDKEIMPYTIRGTAENLNYVYLNDNGAEYEIKVIEGEDGIGHWQYEVKTEDSHNVTVIGAFGKGNAIGETKEALSFETVFISPNVKYTVKDDKICAQILIDAQENASGSTVTAVYEEESLIDVAVCPIKNNEEVYLTRPQGDYVIKTFFFDETLKPSELYETIVRTKAETEG